MQTFKTAILVAFLAALAGCASGDKSSIQSLDKSPICPKTHGWQAWSDVRCNPPEPPRDLAAELAAAQNEIQSLNLRLSTVKGLLADCQRDLAALRSSAGDSANLTSQQLSAANKRNADLEAQLAAQLAAMGVATSDKDKLAAELAASKQQLADRDKELADLRGELSAEMAKLREAERGLIRALRPQIEKGDITVDLNNERLLINLASGYLFGSGQDELNPAGADALKQVGAVLKDYPEYKVAVDGHTDNVAIRGELKKKFPTNQELSESRAANAAKALTEGGLGAATTHGYAETKPVEPNTTASGRAKNRRVEVRVTR
jgi:chemotaxis protein MotB